MSAVATGAPAGPREHRRSTREWLADRNKVELAAWIGLILLAIVLRLYDLGSRPFHHDESQDAYFSYTASKDFFSYAYDPLLHGPFRFFLTAGVYKAFGDSDFTARLAPAAMGVIVVALPYLLRRRLGSIAAFVAGVAFAIGPSYLYFSRFAREDIYFAALSLGLIVAVFRYLDRPTAYGPSIILGIVAAMFACKETAFISMAVAGAFFIPAAFVKRTGVWAAMKANGWIPWLFGLGTFLLVWGIFFGVFFTQWANPHPVTNPDGTTSTYYAGFLGGFTDGIQYWLHQQDVGRGGESPLLYPAIILGDEWPVLLLGIVGIVWTLRRRDLFRIFLVVAFLGQLAIYMWASERFSWLVLHPLLPLILLAGIGAQALWRASRSRGMHGVAAAILVACLVGTAYSSFQANARLGANPRELLVSTQSSQDVKDVVDEVHRMGPDTSITVDSHDGATFPYAWYFRDDDVGYIDMTAQGYQPQSDALVMTEAGQAALADRLGGYQGRRFDFRVWWVREWQGARSPANWFNYVFKRETWNATGGLKEFFYRRR